MISFPPCKINLGLNVIAKRSDGYHDIETCFYPIPWTDIVEVIPSDALQFTSSGLTIPGNEQDNLCLKAYALLKHEFDLPPVKIHLHKILPTGAGLGGGSADAAHTLRLLNSVFDLNLSVNQLRNFAAKLGSDCAFFIEDKPMLGKGRGEILEEIEISLKGKFIVLVNPGIHVATSVAYAGVKPLAHTKPVAEVIRGGISSLWKTELINDFEESVFKTHPQIQQIKDTFYEQGAFYASMSGSGSTVFGIFNEPVNLQEDFNGMMYWSGTL
jgi:4-diphosphocytidyl-2-C-methyl-D-erythritol kinase